MPGDLDARAPAQQDAGTEQALRKTGTTQLLEKKKCLLELHEKLEEEKLVYAKRVEEFLRREDGLRRRDGELEESVVRFSKYLQENDAKRARALRKAADEKNLCAAKAAEVLQLGEEARSLKEELAQAEEVVKRNLRFQEYLEAVVEQRDTFHDIGDVIARHNTLAGTNADLRQQQWDVTLETDRIRSQTQAYAAAEAEEILECKAQLPVLKKQIEDLRAEVAVLDKKCAESQQAAHQEALEQCQVLLAAKNVFRRCLDSSKLPHHDQADFDGQLRVIGNFVADLQGILADHGVQHESSL